MNNYLKYIPAFLFFIFILSFLIHTNTALNQDLGRHIKLGEIILKTHSIPSVNLFSYTNPGFPFVNHHWLSEVIFYLFYKNFGMLSISYLKIFIMLSVVSLVFLISKKISTLQIATFSCFFITPLLISRTDERPELFGFLFFSLLLAIYFFQRNTKEIRKTTYAVPFVLLVWINTHITFIFGFLLLGLFILDQIILKHTKEARTWIILGIISLFVSLLNPHGIRGLLYPLSLYKNYGYSIQENQNLFFLSELTSNIYIKIFWIQSIVIILSGIISLFYEINKKSIRVNTIFYVLFLLSFIASMVAIRNFPFFVFISMISFSHFLSMCNIAISKHLARYKSLLSVVMPIILSGIILIAIFSISTNYFYNTFDEPKRFEMRVEESYKEGVDFLSENHLKEPLLNNFDIGGYLDYRLYPQTKMFVDNRPEAYPNEFFDYYKKSLADLTLTNNLLKKHDIQTIIFSHTDGTPWAQDFLRNLPKLDSYKFVYVDASIIILSKNSTYSINILKQLEKQIDKEFDYSRLLALSNLASLLEYKELSKKALDKAYNENPSSCTARLHKGISDLSSEFVFIRNRAVAILKSTRICPYSNSIKSELATLITQFSSYQ